jgi:hypothetical protein
MGKSLWKWIGDVSTVQFCLQLLGITSVAVLSVWLATATLILRLFAPWSYLVATLIALILAAWLFNFLLAGYQRVTGWKPQPKGPKPEAVRHNADFREVLDYISERSTFADCLKREPDVGARTLMLDKEVMDRIGERGIIVWGRSHHAPVRRISPYAWANCRVDTMSASIRQLPDMPLAKPVLFYDVYLNWRQVRRAWPPRSIPVRLFRWARAKLT